MKKLVIFDLDGTLLNTTRAMASCGNYALEKLGFPSLTPEQYACFSGASVEDFVGAILEAAGDTEHRFFAAFWKYYLEKNEAPAEGANVPYEGICELLSELKKRKIRLAVLSNKDDASCSPIVEGAFGKGIFDVIRGGREDTPAKPDPAGADQVMAQLGVSPEECLYVGDTEVDMLTGKNAGIDTVAALWGYREREVLEAFSPEFLAACPADLVKYL